MTCEMTETIVAVLVVWFALLTFPALFHTLGTILWIAIAGGFLSYVVIYGLGHVDEAFICVGLLVLVGCVTFFGLVGWSFRREERARLAEAAEEKRLQAVYRAETTEKLRLMGFTAPAEWR
jgi:hypothetical protein